MQPFLFHGLIQFHFMYTDHIFFGHSSINGHFGCFQDLATGNMLPCLPESDRVSVSSTPTSGTAGSHGSSSFDFLRIPYTIFQLSSCEPWERQKQGGWFLSLHGVLMRRVSGTSTLENTLTVSEVVKHVPVT